MYSNRAIAVISANFEAETQTYQIVHQTTFQHENWTALFVIDFDCFQAFFESSKKRYFKPDFDFGITVPVIQ